MKTVTIPLQEYNDLIELKRRFDLRIRGEQEKFFNDLKHILFNGIPYPLNPFSRFQDVDLEIRNRKHKTMFPAL